MLYLGISDQASENAENVAVLPFTQYSLLDHKFVIDKNLLGGTPHTPPKTNLVKQDSNFYFPDRLYMKSYIKKKYTQYDVGQFFPAN